MHRNPKRRLVGKKERAITLSCKHNGSGRHHADAHVRWCVLFPCRNSSKNDTESQALHSLLGLPGESHSGYVWRTGLLASIMRVKHKNPMQLTWSKPSLIASPWMMPL